MLVNSDIPSLDPVLYPNALAASAEFRGFPVFDSLISELAPSTKLEYRIAKSLESTDGVVWTLKLRPNVKFSDGTPLDAAAVKFMWDRMADPANKSPQQKTAASFQSTVTDDVTLQITLAERNPFFPTLVAQNLTHIASPKAYQTQPDSVGTSPVGAGGYIVKEFVRNDHLTLVRNPNYYGTTYVDTIVVKTIPDATQQYNTLKSGGADLWSFINVAQATQAQADGFEVLINNAVGVRGLFFNTQAPPFDDVRARQAVSLAIDPDAINKSIYGGQSPPATAYLPESSPFYDPSVKRPARDPKKAQALFDELAAQGKPVEFKLLAGASGFASATLLQAQLAEFHNVKVELDGSATTSDETLFPTRIFNGNYQAFSLGIPLSDPDPGLKNAFGTGGSFNLAKYSSAVVDGALAKSRAATDQAAQKAAFTQVQNQLLGDVPFALTTSISLGLVFSKKVNGVVMYQLATPDFTKIWLRK